MHPIGGEGRVAFMQARVSGALVALALGAAPVQAAAPVTPAQIAALVADPKLAELRPPALVEAVRPLARLKDGQKTDYQWTLFARAARPGLKWIAATFEPDKAADSWRFVSLEVGLVPVGSDEPELEAALVEELTRRLGPPRRERRARVWRLPGQRELYLLRGKETDPTSDPPVEARVVSLEVQPVTAR
jgi:hypothetical protein